MIIDYDYLAKEFAKCWQDKSRVYMIQHYLKTFDNTKASMVPFMLKLMKTPEEVFDNPKSEKTRNFLNKSNEI